MSTTIIIIHKDGNRTTMVDPAFTFTFDARTGRLVVSHGATEKEPDHATA